MKKQKILILSNFGFYTGVIGGQTIKAQNLLNLFLEKKDSKNFEIDFFDTDCFNDRKLILFNFFILFFKLFKSDIFIFSGSKSSLKYLFPFLYFFCKIFNIAFHYIVVGGWLADFLAKNEFYLALLKNVKCIFPENLELCNRLTNDLNFRNVTQLYNFKIFKKEFNKSIKEEGDILKFVFMARVTPEKGVDTLFKIVDKLSGKCNFKIDIYGPLDQKYKAEFNTKLSNCVNYISYKGVVSPENVCDILNHYDCMLFPTRYSGEGFPGTVLDSYISGIPIIASNWQYASELIFHGQTGLIAQSENDHDFIEHVFRLIHNHDLLKILSNGAAEERKKYSAENAWCILEKHILNRELI